MNTFFAVLTDAIDDASLAQELLRDARYRRWLHDDPSAALGVFDAARPVRPHWNVAHERAIVGAAA